MIDILLNIEVNGKNFNEDTWLPEFISIQKKFLTESVTDDDLRYLTEGIKSTIERNLYTGNTYTGESVVPLSFYWSSKKGHSKPFFWTGLLYRSITFQKIINGFEIFILPARATIAALLNYGDSSSNLPARPFWGIIPQRADVLINDMLSRSERRMAA